MPCTAVIGAFGLTPFTLPATALTQVVHILELIFKGALAAMHWLRRALPAGVHVQSSAKCQAALLSCCHVSMNMRLSLIPVSLMAAKLYINFLAHTFI